MLRLSRGRRQTVGRVAGFFLLTGLLGIILTMGGRHGTSPSILEIAGFSQIGSVVYLYSLIALLLAFALGYVVRQNKSDDERHGLD